MTEEQTEITGIRIQLNQLTNDKEAFRQEVLKKISELGFEGAKVDLLYRDINSKK